VLHFIFESAFLKKITAPISLNTNIYQLKAVRVTDKSLVDSGRLFRLTGDPKRYELTKLPGALVLREGSIQLRVCSVSGALRQIDKNLWQRDDGHSSLDIGDNEAVALAKKHIEETKLVPLAECSVLRVTRLRVGTLDKVAGTREERVIDVGVVFQRLVNQVPVEGPGGKVVVFINPQRQVTGVQRMWREIGSVVKAVPFAKLAPPKFAEDHLVKYWKDAPIGRLEVTDSRFGYFELGAGQSQKYLQPAYIMPVTLISPDGHFVMKTVHVVPAALKAAGALMPPRKVVMAQPIRT